MQGKIEHAREKGYKLTQPIDTHFRIVKKLGDGHYTEYGSVDSLLISSLGFSRWLTRGLA